jgi:hypothetical protein
LNFLVHRPSSLAIRKQKDNQSKEGSKFRHHLLQ